MPLAEAVDEAVRRTRAFARRQRAWFRRDPRIGWVDPDADPVAAVGGRRPPGRGSGREETAAGRPGSRDGADG